MELFFVKRTMVIDLVNMNFGKGTFINDVPRFLAVFDLPTYLDLLYNVPFLGLSWIPLPTQYGTSLMNVH